MDALKPLTAVGDECHPVGSSGRPCGMCSALTPFQGLFCLWWVRGCGGWELQCPVCTVSLAARAAGMSGGMYGNGTHQGDKGEALSVSTGNQGWPLGESDLEPTCEYQQGGIGE